MGRPLLICYSSTKLAFYSVAAFHLEREWKPPSIRIEVMGATGYEWEEAFAFEDIIAWQYLPKPPKGYKE